MAITKEDTPDYIKELNFLKIIKRDLERVIKERAVEDIVKQQLADFEEKIRPIVKAEIEKLTFEGIEGMANLMHLREEVQLYFKWSDEEYPKTMYKIDQLVKTEILDK